MKVRTCYICHPGLKRTGNQDNLYYQGMILPKVHKRSKSLGVSKWDTLGLLGFGVFDGMGGEQHGELASFLAADTAKSVLRKIGENRLPSDLLYEICKRANTAIWQKTLELQAQRIGTTMAFVMLHYDTIWCCNVGDSRIYRVRENEFVQLSTDHVAAVRDHAELKPALSAHLGMSPKEMFPNPYLISEKMLEGDVYLICSDGVTDMVNEEVIGTILAGTTIKKAVGRLTKKISNRGGLDNATLVLIQVEEYDVRRMAGKSCKV